MSTKGLLSGLTCVLVLLSATVVIPSAAAAGEDGVEAVAGDSLQTSALPAGLMQAVRIEENRRVAGDLNVREVGHVGGSLAVRVANNIVGGTLRVSVSYNTAMEKIVVEVINNRAGKDILVQVESNRIDPVGGKDIMTTLLDNTAGRDIRVHIKANWVKLHLLSSVRENTAGRDAVVDVSENTVSTITTTIEKNSACCAAKMWVSENIVDYVMVTRVLKNHVTDTMMIEVSNNKYPPGWTMLFNQMETHIISNTVVFGELSIAVDGNFMAINGPAQMEVVIRYNGAGGDVKMSLKDNKAIPGTIRMEIDDNASGDKMTIAVDQNKAVLVDIKIRNNFAYTSAPTYGPQYTYHRNNVQKDLQASGSDSDMDGLTDQYEMMVGTNMTMWDTDDDGLADGWHDTNYDRRWSAGESIGEIGDPRQNIHSDSKRRTNTGGVGSLFNQPNENPGPLCKDIYVEVDIMSGQSFPSSSGSLVVKAFAKQMIRLHIDTGWPSRSTGAAGGRGGGERLPLILPFWIMRHGGPNNDFYDMKQVHFDVNRRGTFHYAIIAHSYNEDPNSPGATPSRRSVADGDDFLLADNVIRRGARQLTAGLTVLRATQFMHELGHNLGLVPAGANPYPFDGIDEPDTLPLSPTYDSDLFANYVSVMNYHYLAMGPVDYSDGSHGSDIYGNPDFDDWGTIELKRVYFDWNVYEG